MTTKQKTTFTKSTVYKKYKQKSKSEKKQIIQT
jgi:hypothetical protein